MTAFFGMQMIVNNVAVTPVYALWYITMCAGHVSRTSVLNYNTMVHKYLKTKCSSSFFVTRVCGNKKHTCVIEYLTMPSQFSLTKMT